MPSSSSNKSFSHNGNESKKSVLTSESGRSTHRVSRDDALAYMDKVKTHYRNDPAVYKEFISLFVRFRDGKTNLLGLLTRLAELFAGEEELILELNHFLYPDYKIVLMVFYRKKETNGSSKRINDSSSKWTVKKLDRGTEMILEVRYRYY